MTREVVFIFDRLELESKKFRSNTVETGKKLEKKQSYFKTIFYLYCWNFIFFYFK